MKRRERPARRTLIASISLFAIFIIIGFVIWDRDRNHKDDNPSTNGSVPQSNTQSQESASVPVTIIIIDDFSVPLKSLVNRVAEEGAFSEEFMQAADDIRGMVDQYSQNGPVIRENIIERVGPLKEGMADLVRNSEEMNLGDRSIDDTNCGISPEGSSIFATEGASIFATEGASLFATDGASLFVTDGASLWDQPHGERVEMELTELLGLPQAQGLNIQLKRLDAHGFVFPEMAKDLDTTISDIRAENPAMRIVVNMSFAIVPCGRVTDIVTYTRLLREFNAENGDNDVMAFREVLDALYKEDSFHAPLAGSGTFQSEFCPEDSPFAACLAYPPGEKPNPEQMLYFVAASGNGIKDENGAPLGVDYPFYPAAWPEVIAVSASDAAGHFAVASPPRASYSNAGRIIMGGTWEPDASIWTPRGVLDKYPQMGTSFAAPRYSFIVALYLAEAKGIDVGCGPGQLPPPADPIDWLAGTPPSSKVDRNHCSP